MQSQLPVRRGLQWVASCCAVGCVYFQASAASALLADTLLPPLPNEAPAKVYASGAFAGVAPQAAAPLFANNPFDWRVDLDPEPRTDDVVSDVAGDVAAVDPLLAEICAEVSVTIVTESSDPLESVSVLRGPNDEAASQRRVGDRVGSYEVAYIGFNRTKASPAVWLVGNSGLCQTLLFSQQPPAAARDGADRSPQARRDETTHERRRARSVLPPELAARFTKLSETQVTVERGVVDQVLADPTAFMSAARIVPAKDGPSGTPMIRLNGVPEGSLLHALNLKNGDFLSRINGFELGNPEQAMAAYARLRTADNLSIEVVRQGKPVTLQVTLK